MYALTKMREGQTPGREIVYNAYNTTGKPSTPEIIEANLESAQTYQPIPVKTHVADLIDPNDSNNYSPANRSPKPSPPRWMK